MHTRTVNNWRCLCVCGGGAFVVYFPITQRRAFPPCRFIDLVFLVALMLSVRLFKECPSLPYSLASCRFRCPRNVGAERDKSVSRRPTPKLRDKQFTRGGVQPSAEGVQLVMGGGKQKFPVQTFPHHGIVSFFASVSKPHY